LLSEKKKEEGRSGWENAAASSISILEQCVGSQMSVTKGLIDAFDDDAMDCVGNLRIMVRQSRLV
jgi:hypothetical protein